MALNGNLGFVPLDEILRLLARSDQKGCVAVRGDGLTGRIFMTKRGVALATVTDDRTLHQRLANSGTVDEGALRRAASGEAPLASTETDSGLVNLLREISVESIHQMRRSGDSFEVDEEAESPYASPKTFELESILEDSRLRSEQWASVSRVLPDIDGVLRINRDLGDRQEVRLNREAWMVIAELDGESTARRVATRLGTTDFWVARVAADLAADGLLLVPQDQEVVPEPATEWSGFADEEPAVTHDQESDPNESWWVEPEPATPATELEEASEEAAAEADEAEQLESGGRLLGAFAERRNTLLGQREQVSDAYEPAVGGAGESVGEDTEAFLEKVFSELEGGDAETAEGHGLLRRRRLGGSESDSH